MTRASLSAALATLLLAACPADPRDADRHKSVAKVGDAEISQTAFLSALAQRGTPRVDDPARRTAVARAVLDEMIDEELLLHAARKAGITVDDHVVDREVRSRGEDYPPGSFQRLLVAEQLTIDQFEERVRRRLLVDAYLRVRLVEVQPISEEEVRAYYDRTVATQKIPEQVRARQILVRTSEEARHILDQLRGRKLGFEGAASRFSSAPDAELGGDLGWFSKGEMPDVFDVCFNLEIGTVSDVVASDYGFHIFQVVDRRAERVETLEAARDRIEDELVRERQTAFIETLVSELRNEVGVSINERAFDRVLALLPPTPVVPSEAPPDGGASRSLDSHAGAVDPVPPRGAR